MLGLAVRDEDVFVFVISALLDDFDLDVAELKPIATEDLFSPAPRQQSRVEPSPIPTPDVENETPLVLRSQEEVKIKYENKTRG